MPRYPGRCVVSARRSPAAASRLPNQDWRRVGPHGKGTRRGAQVQSAEVSERECERRPASTHKQR